MICSCYCHDSQLSIQSAAEGGCLSCWENHAATPPESQAWGTINVNGQPIGRTIMHTTTFGDALADQHPSTIIFEDNLDSLRAMNKALQGSLELTTEGAQQLIDGLLRDGYKIPDPLRQAILPHAKEVNEIAELAAQHEAGEIDDDAYAQRVQELLAS